MPETETDPSRADFDEHTRHLFVDVAQPGEIAKGRRPARRAVFRKTRGGANGVLVLDPSRPSELREGIFADDRYPVWMRSSEDIPPEADDVGNGTIGVGIKLFGITTATLADVDPEGPTADLIFRNHDVFFVDTGSDMCVFTDLALQGRMEEWFLSHPETRQILADMAKREESVITATYWSVLPYALGAGCAVKYRLRPLQSGPSQAHDGNHNRLASDLANRLAMANAALAFDIQIPLSGTSLPLDEATFPWPETYGDSLAFSPWRVPEANQPLGSIALSRRSAYPSSGGTAS